MENKIKFNQMWRHSFLYIAIIVAISMSCSKEDMPEKVPTYYTAISAGFASLALEPDGTLWAWGDNYYGQLGDGTFDEKNRPTKIGSGYLAISAEETHSLALKTDSTLWAWGSNEFGQLGDGTFINKNTPELIGYDFTTIAAGGTREFGFSDSHSLALKSDGTLWAWGRNGNGQLGDGTMVDKNTPVRIGFGYAAIAGGGISSFALKKDGTIWGWGYGWMNHTRFLTPVKLSSGYYTAIAAGSDGFLSFLALKSDGTIWSRGPNEFSQLGDGSGYTMISAGLDHYLALKIDGTLWAWGNNYFGQLGDGTLIDKNLPVMIDSGYATISAGGQHSLALKTDGTLWAWGANFWGQLGDGTYENKNTPVQIGPR